MRLVLSWLSWRNACAGKQRVEIDERLVVVNYVQRPHAVLDVHLAREPLKLVHCLRRGQAHAQDRYRGAADVIAHEGMRDVPWRCPCVDSKDPAYKNPFMLGRLRQALVANI